MSERSIKNFIPNLITLTGLCFGLSSIRFAVLEDFKAAVVCILIAAICDVLDGLFSRLLKTQSDLGAELDSLADFLSFGVAPGILVYFGILWAGLNFSAGLTSFNAHLINKKNIYNILIFLAISMSILFIIIALQQTLIAILFILLL